MDSQKNNDKNKKYLLAIIAFLLLLNGIFIFRFLSTDKKLNNTTDELVETKSAKQDLELLVAEVSSQLDEYKGKNAQLDAEIAGRNQEIQEKAKQIEAMLKSDRVTKRELAKAMEELDVLRYYKKKYLGQIDSLFKVNDKLIKENSQISENLNKEKNKVDDLTMKNIGLENKVSLGKKLSFANLEITGVNKRGSGRESETTRISRMDLLKVSFKLDLNYVTDLGRKDIYMKVIAPNGSTLSSEAMGGGMFRFQGSDNLYTMIHSFDFDNTQQQVTFYYDKGSDWEKGDYVIELYEDGLQIAKERIKLR